MPSASPAQHLAEVSRQRRGRPSRDRRQRGKWSAEIILESDCLKFKF